MAELNRNKIGVKEYKINKVKVYPTKYPAIAASQAVFCKLALSKIAHWTPIINVPKNPKSPTTS